MFSTETVIVDGVKLLAPLGTSVAMADKERWHNYVNGCGAGNARIDFVPDTMYALRVTPV